MEGVWKREGKQQFEVWEKTNDQLFTGFAYTIVENKKVISETLQIQFENKEWIFKATVPNQNQGKPVQFILNTNEKGMNSFENLSHDFPKKIQYTRIAKNKVKVNVLGGNGKGFSYLQTKLKEE